MALNTITLTLYSAIHTLVYRIKNYMLLNFNVHVKYLKNLTSISSSVIPSNSPRRIFIEEYINSVCCLFSINALTPMIVLALIYSKSDIFAA